MIFLKISVNYIWAMDRMRCIIKRALTPVTVMLVPHTCSGELRMRVPAMVLAVFMFLSLAGGVYVYTLADAAFRYEPTRKELEYYKGQFAELEVTITSLASADREFRTLFDLGDRSGVLENLNETDMGDIDMTYLKKQINHTIDTVGEIRDYLSEARDLYMATPMGWPVEGWMSSRYGYRTHPIKGTRMFHSGLDIATRPGKPIRATADGIVSFSGRSGSSGNLVAVEHGYGYRTHYAHNKKNEVSVGQVVKRGDIVAYVGSTGSSTGPHSHYEVWKEGKAIDPMPFVKGGRW